MSQRVSDERLARLVRFDNAYAQIGGHEAKDIVLDLLDTLAENAKLLAVVEAARALGAVVPGTQEYWLAEEALFAALDALNEKPS